MGNAGLHYCSMSQNRNGFNGISAVFLFFSALFLAPAPGTALSWQNQNEPFSVDLSIYKFGRAGAFHLQGAVPTAQTWDFFTEETPPGSSEVGIPLINEIRGHPRTRRLDRPFLPLVTTKVSAYLFNSVLIL
jgi:hypothetical protein